MRRPDRRGVLQWLGIAAVLAVVGWGLYQVQLQSDRVDALASALGAEQEATEDRGETPVAPDPDELIDDPDAQGPPGPPGPPPSDEQVYAAVEEYFAEHPVEDGETPSAAEIAAAVASYLSENPPEPGEPGPPPTAEQVAAAVEQYLTANPPPAGPAGEDGDDGEQGPPGPQGEPGRPPTAEEIAAEVEAYLIDHPLPTCPAGSSAEAHTVLTTGGAVDVIVCVRQPEEE